MKKNCFVTIFLSTDLLSFLFVCLFVCLYVCLFLTWRSFVSSFLAGVHVWDTRSPSHRLLHPSKFSKFEKFTVRYKHPKLEIGPPYLYFFWVGLLGCIRATISSLHYIIFLSFWLFPYSRVCYDQVELSIYDVKFTFYGWD